MPFDRVDVEVDNEGELLVDGTGDLKLASAARTLTQDISTRLKTDYLDFGPSPYIGADLGSVLGLPNTQRTADLIADKVYRSLTWDGRIPRDVLVVEVIPTNIHKVAIVCVVKDVIVGLDTPLVTAMTWNFTTGVEELIDSVV